jgi:hypothetical protein
MLSFLLVTVEDTEITVLAVTITLAMISTGLGRGQNVLHAGISHFQESAAPSWHGITGPFAHSVLLQPIHIQCTWTWTRVSHNFSWAKFLKRWALLAVTHKIYSKPFNSERNVILRSWWSLRLSKSYSYFTVTGGLLPGSFNLATLRFP